MHTLTAILAGGGAGAWTALLLPMLARHIGARGEVSAAAILLLVAGGAALAPLLERLIRWACPVAPAPRATAIMLPWSAIFFLPCVFLLPEGARLGMTGSILGPVKHALSAAWILGAGLFATRLLPPLLAEFRPVRIAAGCTAIMLLISFAISTQPPNESDEGDYVAAAIALLDSGETRIDRVFRNGEFNDFYFGKMPSSSRWYEYQITYHPAQTNRFSYRMVGYPLILASFIKAAGMTEIPHLRWLISFFPGFTAYFLLMLAIAAAPELKPTRAGRTTIIAIASMTPLLYYPTNTQPEIWMVTGIAWALLLRDRHLREGRSVIGFAAVTTLLMLLHERMAIFSFVLISLTVLASRDRRRLLLTSALCLVPVLFSYAAVLQFQLPTGAPHAYGIEGVPFFDGRRWLEAARQHLFSVRIGLFIHLPILLLLPLGLRRTDFTRKHPHGEMHRVLAVLVAVYFLVIITYPHTFDSFPHLRYLVPALPALGLLLPAASARVEKMRLGPALIALLLGLQIARAWPFLAVPHLWRWFL